MTYDESAKEFNITWRTDTEHLEGVLTAFSSEEIRLENATIDKHASLIDKYIRSRTSLALNDKNIVFEVNIVEVTFAETIVHFKAIPCRRKLKALAMENTLLLDRFPNQKNMVQVNYYGKMYSLLLSQAATFEKINLE